MLIQRYDLNKNKSMNNIKIILIMLKYKYIPSNSHGYTYFLLYPIRGTSSIGGLSSVLYLILAVCFILI